MRGRRSRFATVSGVGVALLLAACGGSAGSAGSGVSPAAGSAAVGSGAPPTGAAPGGTAAAGAASTGAGGPTGAAPRCAAADLGVAFGSAGVSTGDQRQRPIILTNRAGRGCAVTGFPGVQLIARDGSDYFDLVRSSIVRPTRIVLAPGGTARATMRYMPAPPGETGAYDVVRVVVTVPDATTSTSLPWDGGPVSDQSGATHPGTYIEALTAG
ncbi:DUF4232 domain-containing protein [Frankia sp. AgB32]|uniref:DUF4232 domain-containing protein n=1 Tax=Frankia sp. AgB32 TaxID=631119 RepID=UPI00200CF726|nr:DUF4232 domain-containing protein [Frankia sp. AgB32]MCK9895429.1 DUF4232 domain-containing protein [Frankia sp. AgB32]